MNSDKTSICILASKFSLHHRITRDYYALYTRTVHCYHGESASLQVLTHSKRETLTYMLDYILTLLSSKND